MAKIVSRHDSEAANIQRLQQVLIGYSHGHLGYPGDSAPQDVADSIPDLIEQADLIIHSYNVAAKTIEMQRDALLAQREILYEELENSKSMLASIVDDIDYDEALDHATADLMDAFCASGSADISADGHLIFDERISFTKQDIKPMLREAIVRWVEQRMSR